MNGKINYNKLVDNSMRNVVREILRRVQENGLHGEQHFYITFQTNFPGVILSDDMRARFPSEITIVVQHQFENLQVKENIFSIELSFSKVSQSIVVPFSAITSLADPSEDFAIQLQKLPYTTLSTSTDNVEKIAIEKIKTLREKTEEPEEELNEDDSEGNVVALDSFRKKVEKNDE